MKRTIAILVCLLPTLAMASESLQQAKVLYDDMDYEKALVQLTAALGADDMGPDDMIEAYRLQGLCLVASDNPDQAMESFKKLLSLDPEAKISTEISPKLAAPFYQAMAISKDLKPISLDHKPNFGAVMDVRLVSDPMDLVKGLRVVTTKDGIDWKKGAEYEVGDPGVYKLKIDKKVKQYYFEAMTESGNILTRAGSKLEPFDRKKLGTGAKAVAAAQDAKPEEKPAALDTTNNGTENKGDDEGAAVVWYKTWWFWTAVGVVVVGGAVGGGVAASGGDKKAAHANYAITVN